MQKCSPNSQWCNISRSALSLAGIETLVPLLLHLRHIHSKQTQPQSHLLLNLQELVRLGASQELQCRGLLQRPGQQHETHNTP